MLYLDSEALGTIYGSDVFIKRWFRCYHSDIFLCQVYYHVFLLLTCIVFEIELEPVRCGFSNFPIVISTLDGSRLWISSHNRDLNAPSFWNIWKVVVTKCNP